MKILHVAQALSRNFGGVQTVLHEIVNAQREAGLQVDVISTNVDAPRGVLSVEPNRFIEQRGVRFRYSSVQFRPLLLSFDLRHYLVRNVAIYDVIHIHGLYRFPLTYAAYQARKQCVPYIIRPHGSLDPYLYGKSSRSVWLKRLYERWFDLPNLRAADAIHYTSDEERERVSFLKLQTPSFVIPNGIDWSRFECLPARGAFRIRYGYGSEPLVLFLGRLHFKKGLDLLVPAFAAVRSRFPEAKLAIVGPENDDYGQRVRRWVSEHGVNDAVRFIGHLDGSDILQAYVDADVFVLPSYTENFGMTVVEAMACGLPVVISDQVNIHAQVTASGAGQVTRCEVDEVTDAITELLGDKDRRKAMGQAGRRAAQVRYSWPAIVDALTREYEAVIERARQRHRAIG